MDGRFGTARLSGLSLGLPFREGDGIAGLPPDFQVLVLGRCGPQRQEGVKHIPVQRAAQIVYLHDVRAGASSQLKVGQHVR